MHETSGKRKVAIDFLSSDCFGFFFSNGLAWLHPFSIKSVAYYAEVEAGHFASCHWYWIKVSGFFFFLL